MLRFEDAGRRICLFGSILTRVAQYHTTRRRAYTSGVSGTFGERLRTLRSRRHLTPGALAQAVGVTEGAIRQMESGQTKSASFLVGLKLAAALGVTPWFLATGSDAAPETAPPAAERSTPAMGERISALERRVNVLEGRRGTAPRRTTKD